MKRHVAGALGLAALAVAGCTSDDGSAAPQPTTSLVAPRESSAGLPGHEVRAISTAMETWALLHEPPPWKAGQEVKVVWRSTGTGELSVVAVGPRAQEVPPVSGPTGHVGSNWNRPGEEWGTFFLLDEPGLWLLRVRRGAATASLPVEVIR